MIQEPYYIRVKINGQSIKQNEMLSCLTKKTKVFPATIDENRKILKEFSKNLKILLPGKTQTIQNEVLFGPKINTDEARIAKQIFL